MQVTPWHMAAVLATVCTSVFGVGAGYSSSPRRLGMITARQEIADPSQENEVAATDAKAREIYDRAVSVVMSMKTLDLVVSSSVEEDASSNAVGAARVRLEFDSTGEFPITNLRVDIAGDGGDPANPRFTVVLNAEGAIALDFVESVFARAPKDNPLDAIEPCLSALPHWVLNTRFGGDEGEIARVVWLEEEEVEGVLCDVIAVMRVLQNSTNQSTTTPPHTQRVESEEAAEESDAMEEESDAEAETEEESIAVAMWVSNDGYIVDAPEVANRAVTQEEQVGGEDEADASSDSSDEPSGTLLIETLAVGRADGFPRRVAVVLGSSESEEFSDALLPVVMSEVVLDAGFDATVFVVTPPEGWEDVGAPSADSPESTPSTSKGTPRENSRENPQDNSSGVSKGNGTAALAAPKGAREKGRSTAALMSEVRDAALPLLLKGASGGEMTLA